MCEDTRMIRVFKFGGASVKDAAAVRNLAGILNGFQAQPLLIVVSAMGKTTNALERLIEISYTNKEILAAEFQHLKGYHFRIIIELFPANDHVVYNETEAIFTSLWDELNQQPDRYNAFYDTVVVYGELISTCIVGHYLIQQGLSLRRIDARDYVRTDNHYKSANVDWDETQKRIATLKSDAESGVVLLTQGFIGSAPDGTSTTLGREGSDYTAAIFAWCLEAFDVVIWKDVPGLLNADPKRFEEVRRLDQISYGEAIELAYYGATIIHPKTIKPLQNKKIPLKVQSFHQPELPPSLIADNISFDPAVPSIIVKDDQALVSISPRDFSFMNEKNLHYLFEVFDELDVHVHLMQTSALSLSVCTDVRSGNINSLFDRLSAGFVVRYNTGLQLITIRHYNQDVIERITGHCEILLEQRSRTTAQYVVR